MENLEETSLPTPYFGPYKKNKILLEELLGKRILNSTSDVFQNLKNNKKSKNTKKEKSKEKRKDKNKSKKKSKSKNRHKNSKTKTKKVPLISFPIEQNYENPFDIFLKKRISLRNDFDQNNSEKFLFEKELAFQQFWINEDSDYLDN